MFLLPAQGPTINNRSSWPHRRRHWCSKDSWITCEKMWGSAKNPPFSRISRSNLILRKESLDADVENLGSAQRAPHNVRSNYGLALEPEAFGALQDPSLFQQHVATGPSRPARPSQISSHLVSLRRLRVRPSSYFLLFLTFPKFSMCILRIAHRCRAAKSWGGGGP